MFDILSHQMSEMSEMFGQEKGSDEPADTETTIIPTESQPNNAMPNLSLEQVKPVLTCDSSYPKYSWYPNFRLVKHSDGKSASNCLMFCTVGARIPNTFGFRTVHSRSVLVTTILKLNFKMAALA